MLLFFLLSCLAICVSGQVTVSTCPEGWVENEDACYGVGEDKVSWQDAQGFCNMLGGKLAEPTTPGKNAFIKSQARTKHLGFMWVGATDTFNEGNWIWASTGKNVLGFSDWALGQPNDDGGQDCLHLYPDSDYKWGDEQCSKHYSFICERSLKVDEPVIG